MEFRPCIDIHNGKVKQIVGGSLHEPEDGRQSGTAVVENYVASQDAAFFAELYHRLGLKGGHIIMLNNSQSAEYSETRAQALLALAADPGGWQIGGGITADNAAAYLNAGASHVIVTSYVFGDGVIKWDRLEQLAAKAGAGRVVLDLSCRQKEHRYYIVTDRWQKYTDVVLSEALLTQLSSFCAEFLIHAVDVEGIAGGIDEELTAILGQWTGKPITYAGGVHDFTDLEKIKRLGKDRVNVTVGSALDLFGGGMKITEVLAYIYGR